MTLVQADTLFDSLRHRTADGAEYWSARELMPALGYQRWENAQAAITRAIEACENSQLPSDTHFRATTKKVDIGGTARRDVLDYHLTRYGAYLTAMNSDPGKAEVAAAQTYFAVMTRQAETRPTSALAQARLMLEALEHQEARVTAIEQRLDRTPIRMHSAARTRVYDAVKSLGKIHPKGFRGAWHQFRSTFGIGGIPLSAGDDLPLDRLDEALNWIETTRRALSGGQEG